MTKTEVAKLKDITTEGSEALRAHGGMTKAEAAKLKDITTEGTEALRAHGGMTKTEVAKLKDITTEGTEALRAHGGMTKTEATKLIMVVLYFTSLTLLMKKNRNNVSQSDQVCMVHFLMISLLPELSV